MTDHKIRYEPQPIAGQIMVECSCGWRKGSSMWNDEPWVIARRLAADHLDDRLIAANGRAKRPA